MREREQSADLVEYLVRTTHLGDDLARKILDDITGYLHETVEEFLRRRHAELQSHGAANADIYTTLVDEIQQRRFKAADLSTRQIRRIIYG